MDEDQKPWHPEEDPNPEAGTRDAKRAAAAATAADTSEARGWKRIKLGAAIGAAGALSFGAARLGEQYQNDHSKEGHPVATVVAGAGNVASKVLAPVGIAISAIGIGSVKTARSIRNRMREATGTTLEEGSDFRRY